MTESRHSPRPPSGVSSSTRRPEPEPEAASPPRYRDGDERRPGAGAERHAERGDGRGDEVEAEPQSDEERARRLAEEVGEDNPDPVTRREAIEQALSDEDVSDEGEELGQHNN